MGLGTSASRTSFAQCLNGSRIQVIGRRHLTTRTSVVPDTSLHGRYGLNGACLLLGLQPNALSSSRLPSFLSSRRHNSSNTPSRSTEKATTTTSTTTPGQLQEASTTPPKSILSRLSGLISLEGAQTTGETGHSSVAKLVELAKPEKKQLAMAVGLVSSWRWSS